MRSSSTSINNNYIIATTVVATEVLAKATTFITTALVVTTTPLSVMTLSFTGIHSNVINLYIKDATRRPAFYMHFSMLS
jgi:hypothetical protein